MGGNKMRQAFVLSLFFSCLVFSSPLFAEETLSGLNIQGFSQRSKEKVVWSKNPFVQPADDVAVSELQLTGIVYNKDKAAAIIGNTIVKVGDKLGYNEIVGIEKGHVILRNENGLFRLSLRGGR